MPQPVRLRLRDLFDRARRRAPGDKGRTEDLDPTGRERLDCAFCGTCGVRLWHRGMRAPETLSVKGGSFDAPVDLTSARHIWTSRRLPGIIIPDHAETFPEEPR